MKKYILSALFALVTCITFGNTTFKTAEIAPWNQSLMIVKVTGVKQVAGTQKVFTDPYVTSYGAYLIGRTLQLQVSLDHSAPVKWLVTLRVYGIWNSQPGGASYKSFDLIINSGGWNKTLNIALGASETAYTSLVDELYEGPY